MEHTQCKWGSHEWREHSEVMLLESRFCMWEQSGRIWLKDMHTQRKTSLTEAYNNSKEKGFQRALIHFENFISIAKANTK